MIETTISAELETLLRLIAEAVQLPRSLHEKAHDRYRTLTELMAASELGRLSISVYPQGSYRIGTTVRPLADDEFDLDFVVEIVPIHSLSPGELLDRVWDVVRWSGRYAGMVERRPSCIRITYADEFHMDIVPAISNPSLGDTAILIPRVSGAELGWHATDPKAYAAWFEDVSAWRMLAKEMKVEPLPNPVPADNKTAVQTCVQLYKRNHHVRIVDEHLRAASIILTTIAAHAAPRSSSLGEAIERLIVHLDSIAGLPEPPVISNPAASYEVISEKWIADTRIYDAFTEHSRRLQKDWQELKGLQGMGYDALERKLSEMFGVRPVREAMKSMAEATRSAGGVGRLSTGTGGILSIGATTRPNPHKTFYGDAPD